MMIRLLSPRWRKVFRDMWSNKTRTLLVVMSIAVGVFAIGVVTGAQRIFLSALNASYGASNPASGQVFVRDSFGDDLVEVIDNLREVAVAEGRRESNLRYKLRAEDDWQSIEVVYVSDFEEMEIIKVLPKGGAWPPDDEEMLINLGSQEYLGVDIGTPILIETDQEKLRQLTITGLVRDQNGPPASITGVPTGYINQETLEWLNEPAEFTRLSFTVAENPLDRDHIRAVGEIIENKIENSGLDVIFVRVPPPGEHPLNNILEPLLYILTGLGGLALALSGFLVVNIISAIIAQQTRQIGIMKSIGGRQSQIIRLYFGMVFGYGLLALLIAIPAGMAGAWAFTLFLADFFNVEIEQFSFSTTAIIIQALIALLVPTLAAIVPILSGTRVTVREAISNYGLGSGRFGTSLVDRIMQRLRGLSRPLMISLRNTFRRKFRLSLTLMTLTLAGATFITIYSIRDSMLSTVDDILAIWQFDISVNLSQTYRIAEVEEIAFTVPGVEHLESWAGGSVRRLRSDGSEGDNVSLVGLPTDTRTLAPQLVSGRWLLPQDEGAVVVNTDFLQDEPDIKVGDEVVLTLEEQELAWTVVGVIQGATVGSNLYTTYDYYTRLVSEVDKTSEIQIITSSRDGAEHAKIAQQLEFAFDRAGMDVGRVGTITEIRTRTRTSFDFLLQFLLSMAVVLAIVGGLGLSGTMSINVLERVREIGVMRAVGASDNAVLKIVLIEGVLIGLISWLLGATLALPLSRILSDQLGILLLDNPLSFTFSVFGLTLWFGVALVLAFIASYLPARNASRLTVREVLAYE